MRNRKKLFIFAAVLILCLALPLTVSAEEKWLGTDDLVDGTMEELGISAKEPLVDISQGNLGLFLFVVAGFVSGSLAGYYWRKIFAEKAGQCHD